MKQDYKKIALEYTKAGLSVIRCNLDTKAAQEGSSWKIFQSTIVSEQAIKDWTLSHNTGIAVVCGLVSGGLEIIDIDEKYNLDATTPLLDKYKATVELRSPGLFDKLVHETSQNGGHHLIYRCKTLAGNKKLAVRSTTDKEREEYITRKKTELKAEGKPTEVRITAPQAYALIETRGEGGYFICSPSTGYTLKQGSFTDVKTISTEEREILFECAALFNSYIEETQIIKGEQQKDKGDLRRPGDIFNTRGQALFTKVLKDAGWTLAYTNKDGAEHWIRPGKTQGVSATMNHVPNIFYVFSSSAAPFESNKGYSRFAVYALLLHKGNFEEAAIELRALGYTDTAQSRLEDFLRKRYDFRRNAILYNTEWKPKLTSTWRDLEDEDVNSFKRHVLNSGMKITVNDIWDTLESDWVEKYDPFNRYFNTLPAWDNVDRLGELVKTLKLRDPSIIGRVTTYVTRWMVAAAACAMIPEIINQTCLILVGPQSRFKTTWLESLVPTPLKRYKVMGMVREDDKDSVVRMSENFMINLDELSNLTKYDIEGLKSIITNTGTRSRSAFEHKPKNFTRRCSFVGSINKTGFLSDETGTRRFLTVWIEDIDMDARNLIDENQLWAQVIHLFNSGFRYWFNSIEADEITQFNKVFNQATIEEEMLEMHATTRKPSLANSNVDDKGQAINWLPASAIAKEMEAYSGVRADHRAHINYGKALTKKNYHFKNLNGLKFYSIDIIRNIHMSAPLLQSVAHREDIQ